LGKKILQEQKGGGWGGLLKKFKGPFPGAHAGSLLRTLVLLLQGSQQNLLAQCWRGQKKKGLGLSPNPVHSFWWSWRVDMDGYVNRTRR